MSEAFVLGLVLHHGRPAAVRRCLIALAVSRRPPDRVLLVDNGSGDGARVVAGAPVNGLDVEVVSSHRNRGYAGGVNLALDAAATLPWTATLLLNDDAMVAEDCLSRLLAASASRPRAGLLGAEIRRAGSPRRLESTGLRWSPLTGRVRAVDAGRRPARSPGPPQPRQALSGCALLATRAAVERAGGLDPSFFLYFEDLDWSRRVARAGFDLLYVPGAVAYHEGGRLSGAARVYYSTRNQLRLAEQLDPRRGPGAAIRRLAVVLLNLAAVPRTARRQPLAGLRAWWGGWHDARRGHAGPRPEVR